MRQFINLIKEAAETSQKIDRSAFIYLPPKGEKNNFAQCASCLFFKPNSEKCGIFNKKTKVTKNQSCGLYVHGKPDENQECRDVATPEQAGLVDGPVRCENCSWFDGKCGLFKKLNKEMPDVFSVDENVDENGCCNAFQST